MTETQKMSQSLCVCRKIINTAEWQSCKNILLYEPLSDEVSLSLLFEEAKAMGIQVWMPTNGADAEMLSDIVLRKIDLAIIPGRAFTVDGYRLGRGKGYYDRLIPRLSCKTIGVAFDCQIFDTLPVDDWDVRLDMVLSTNL